MTPAGRRKLLAHLPKAHGFRPGGDVGLKEQLRHWLLNLKRNPRDWYQAMEFLSSWANGLAATNGLPPFKEVLTSFDNESEDPALDDPERVQNSDLDIECFRYLRDRNRSLAVDRETISDFYELGYFLRDERIESIISDCWPRAELLERRNAPAEASPPAESEEGRAPNTVATDDQGKPSLETTDSARSLAAPSSVDIVVEHSATAPSATESAERPSSTPTDLQHRGADPGHREPSPLPSRSDEIVSVLADLSTRLTALERRADVEAAATPLLTELVTTVRATSQDCIGVLRDIERTVSRAITALESARSEPQPVMRPSDAAPGGAVAHRHAVVPAVCTAAPFPSEDTFLQQMGFTFRRWGLSSDDASVRFAYVALQAFPVLLATAPGTASGLQEVLSPDGVLRTFHVPGGWSSPEWIDALPPALTSLQRSLRFGPNGTGMSSQCPAILRFEDYDRSLPEAYLIAAAKNVRSTRDALIIAARSADASHVLPSGTFLSLSCDVDVVVQSSGASSPVPLERILCHSPATDLYAWAQRRRADSKATAGTDLGIFEPYLRAPAYRAVDVSCLRDALVLSEGLLPRDTVVQWLAAAHVAPLLAAVDGNVTNATELLDLVEYPNAAYLVERLSQSYVG